MADCRLVSRRQRALSLLPFQHHCPDQSRRLQVARAIVESGEAPDEIARALQQAQVEGQGNFTVADALDNAGQRMPSTVARAPGEGRTAAVNFLENRQAGQGRRVSSALAEGFDTRETAAQTESRLTQARNDANDAEFAGFAMMPSQ